MPRVTRVSSYASAARLVDVTPATVKRWVDIGRLPAGPWTPTQIRRASDTGRQRGGRGSTASHGSPSRWRAGCDCAPCGLAHNEDVRTRRETARAAAWQEHVDVKALLDALAAGDDYGQTLAEFKITPQRVTMHRRRDPQFAAELDTALIAGRDPHLIHGSPTAWRKRCRCPECRAAHEATR